MHGFTSIAPATVPEAALRRRSVRKYTGESVSPEAIHELVHLASRAPSAFNVQPWRFIAVTSPELKSQLQAAAYGQAQVGAAPVLFVLVSDMEDAMDSIRETVHPALPAEKFNATAETVKTTFGGMSVEARANWANAQSYIALGYLLLAAESMGLGTSPMLGFDPVKVKEILGLPDHTTIPALVAVGFPAEEGFAPHRHEVDRVLTVLA